jgi:signal peptidase I
VAVALAVVVQGFVVRIFQVPSESMETTLIGCQGCTDDRVAVDRLGYRFHDPAPGDVVVFRGPAAWIDSGDSSASQQRPQGVVRFLQDLPTYAALASPEEKDFVKRVVAVGGQTVACCDRGRVTVDGRPLTEPYLHLAVGTPPEQEAFAPVTLSPGQLWVMGDNRNNSADSRDHGAIATGDVIGRVRAIVLPTTRWSTVPSLDPQRGGTAN